MSSKAEPGRRIVSRSRYALTKTFAFSLSGFLTLCGTSIVLLLVSLPYAAYLDAQQRAAELKSVEVSDLPTFYMLPMAAWLCVLSVPILIIVGFCFWLAGRKSWATVHAMQPIHFVDAAHLPAPESLVRPSQKPIQAQEDVLLRPATNGQELHEEQLLRATIGGQE